MVEIEHDCVINDSKYSSIDSLDARHRVTVDLVVATDLRVIVLALAQDAIVLVPLNLVECDLGVATQTFERLSKDTILIILTERVHEDLWLS